MTQQETGGTGDPSLTESVEAQNDPAATEAQAQQDESPVLNRAARRAQAKNKPGNAASNPAASHNNGARGPGGRPTGHAGPVRFPRTGHK
ncbi:MAG: hypothetical protein M3Y13_11590 [Armatimonadota bacterium]|nr:hypothetical protein [Armatimonadota bacterium]